MAKVICIAILVAFSPITTAQTRPASTLPSTDELHQIFREERYQDVIKNIVRILPFKGEAATQWDRHELLVLKAESHLRLGDFELSAKTFEDAANVTEEPIDAATDHATAALIRRAKRGSYIPRTGALAGEPLSIIEDDGRKLALQALYEDEREAAEKRLASAQEARDLAGSLRGLDLIVYLRDFEFACAGGDIESQAALEPIARHARDMMKAQLKKLSSRAEKLDKAANSRRKIGAQYRKRGLGKDEMAELRAGIEECRRISDAAQRFSSAVASEPLAEEHNMLRRDAQQLIERIEATLAADYSGVYDRN